MSASELARARWLDVAVGLVALAQAVLLATLTAGEPRTSLAVDVDLGGAAGRHDLGGRTVVTSIDLAHSAVAVLAIIAVLRLVSATARVARFRAAAASGGTHGYRWAEAFLVLPILTFLVAQTNGITDIGTLVAIYALASGVGLFAFLQDRAGAHLWAFSFGTMIGIVPWGIIAFHQIGAVIVGEPPSIGVRLLTLTILAAVILLWILQWREVKRSEGVSRGLAADIPFTLTVLAAATALAWAANGH